MPTPAISDQASDQRLAFAFDDIDNGRIAGQGDAACPVVGEPSARTQIGPKAVEPGVIVVAIAHERGGLDRCVQRIVRCRGAEPRARRAVDVALGVVANDKFAADAART
jgi:hypothetical protein